MKNSRTWLAVWHSSLFTPFSKNDMWLSLQRNARFQKNFIFVCNFVKGLKIEFLVTRHEMGPVSELPTHMSLINHIKVNKSAKNNRLESTFLRLNFFWNFHYHSRTCPVVIEKKLSSYCTFTFQAIRWYIICNCSIKL